MNQLISRAWITPETDSFIRSLAAEYAQQDANALTVEIERLTQKNSVVHNRECINLNPATNTMNPRAEALLSSGLGMRPSLGHPGEKYEMGVEAIERIEIIASQLACEIFNARYAELRVPSGSIANLYAFMATCQPGDSIIAPPPSIGGHVTHHNPGAAGFYQLKTHYAPVDAANYTVDVDGLRKLAHEVRPKLITVGGSMNLFPHPIKEIRAIADEVGAYVLFDAAHLSGMIAGRAWQQPLEEGAHLMSMSTYKSLGGPPSGMVLTNDPLLAERLDCIAYPGLTANFDVSKTAALAISLLDWREYGSAYAKSMKETAFRLADNLAKIGLPVFGRENGFTHSHQLVIEAQKFGGGQTVAKLLRRANLLVSGIGLPLPPVNGDMNGLRLGTPEIVRWGMEAEAMPEVARFIGRVLISAESPEGVAADVSAFRGEFNRLHYIRE